MFPMSIKKWRMLGRRHTSTSAVCTRNCHRVNSTGVRVWRVQTEHCQQVKSRIVAEDWSGLVQVSAVSQWFAFVSCVSRHVLPSIAIDTSQWLKHLAVGHVSSDVTCDVDEDRFTVCCHSWRAWEWRHYSMCPWRRYFRSPTAANVLCGWSWKHGGSAKVGNRWCPGIGRGTSWSRWSRRRSWWRAACPREGR